MCTFDLLCTASPHHAVPCNEKDGNEARAEDTTVPQHLQRNPAYCSIEMMKKTTVTYEKLMSSNSVFAFCVSHCNQKAIYNHDYEPSVNMPDESNEAYVHAVE